MLIVWYPLSRSNTNFILILFTDPPFVVFYLETTNTYFTSYLTGPQGTMSDHGILKLFCTLYEETCELFCLLAIIG